VLLVFGFIISFDVPALLPSISQLDLTDLCGSRAFSCFRVGKIPPPVFIWLFPLGFSGYVRGGGGEVAAVLLKAFSSCLRKQSGKISEVGNVKSVELYYSQEYL
jgi:hypothetical protein